MRLSRSAVVLLFLALANAPARADAPAQAALQQFEKEIAPLLADRCLSCHDGPRPKGGLNLATRQNALKGGKNGPALVPGKPGESLMWEHVDDGTMPPKKPLSAGEKTKIQQWIAAGAAWSDGPIDPLRYTTDNRAGYDWWSLKPVKQPRIPLVRNSGWPLNGIDIFVLAGLEAKSLTPAPAAERRTLVRRLYFDLLGLPPTPAEVEAFVQDPAADAYERLVDRLLASPHYGERWGRHWLDVVRFGESHGFEHDEIRRNAWPYRDWVVKAFNDDMPFDEFARLQIAGDVLRPNDPQALTATGFLVAGPYDSVGQGQQSAAMKAVVRGDELEDLVATLGQSFLGLTIHCARCHDHKFDPVRQTEYYRLSAALGGVRHGQRPMPGSDPKTKQTLYAVTPRPPGIAHVLLRGDPNLKDAVVTPGALAALPGLQADFGLAADAADGPRRIKLADWITDPANPLFARVIVNRLWHHHFGVGLVDTPSDFGFSGGRPSHPELLDWLAAELPRHGWRLKAMHRLIVTSATYRQSGRINAEASKIDGGNRLLWRKSPIRLEAEALRDAMLVVAGQFNPTMGGPGYQDFKLNVRGATHEYTPFDFDSPEVYRRSIYRTLARSGRSRLLDTFDCPDPSVAAPNRAVTTTPLQALTLLNNSFVLRMAERFAQRLQREAGADVGEQIVLAYRLAYGRPPSAVEVATARRAVEAHGLPVLCRALFNSNEFLYVD